MNRIDLIQDLSSTYHIMSSYTEFQADCVSDDLDYMLFDGQRKKDIAKSHIRLKVAAYIDHEYQDDVSEFVQSGGFLKPENYFLSAELYQYTKTFTKIRGELFGNIRWMWDSDGQLDLLKCYQNIRKEIGSTDKKINTAIVTDPMVYDCALLHWGEYVKTELQNDGFDTGIVMKKLLDLLFTIACMEKII